MIGFLDDVSVEAAASLLVVSVVFCMLSVLAWMADNRRSSPAAAKLVRVMRWAFVPAVLVFPAVIIVFG